VRDRDRRVIDDPFISTRSGLLADGSIGLAGHEKRIHVSQTLRLASFSATGLESETATFPPARAKARRARRLFNSVLSPVVKYHGLGRATGFGLVRPCNTLASLLGAPGTASPAEHWLDLQSVRASGSCHPRLAAPPSASVRAAFPLDARLTASYKIDNQTDRAFDSQLTPSFTGCPTSR